MEGYIPFVTFEKLQPTALGVELKQLIRKKDIFSDQRNWEYIQSLSRSGNLIFGAATVVPTGEKRAFFLGSSRENSYTSDYYWFKETIANNRLELIDFYHISTTKVKKHLIPSVGAKRAKYEPYVAGLFEECKNIFSEPPFSTAFQGHSGAFGVFDVDLCFWYNIQGWMTSIKVVPSSDPLKRLVLSIEARTFLPLFLHKSIEMNTSVVIEEGWQTKFAQEVLAIYRAFEYCVPLFEPRDESVDN